MAIFVLVGIGGFLGTILRFSFYQLGIYYSFPFSTILVNLMGSLFMGIVLASSLMKTNNELYYFMATGVLGGFTTYSAFSADVINLIIKKEMSMAFLHLSITVIGGLFFCLIGFYLGKFLRL